MNRQTWVGCVLILSSVAVLAGASQMDEVRAMDNQADSRKEIDQRAELCFKKMENAADDRNELSVIFEAMRELTAIGPDVADYAVDKLTMSGDNDLDDNVSAIVAAFVLGHYVQPASAAALLDALAKPGSAGNDPQVRRGLDELTGPARDAMAVLSMAAQAARLDRTDPQSLKLYTKIVEQLRKYLEPDNDSRTFVRMAAVAGLGLCLRDESSVESFCKIAADEKTVAILRAAAVLALANFDHETARATLEEIAGRAPVDRDDWKTACLQANAALALGSFGDKDSLEALKNVLKNKYSAGARNFAWVSIAELGPRHGDDTLLPFLKEQLNNERDLKVRTSAIYALYRMGDAETAVKLLDEILYDSKSTSGRLTYASQILGFIQDEKARDLLLKCLTHPLRDVRRLAVFNLAQWCSDPVVCEKMRAIAKHEKDDTMKQRALLALARIDKLPENDTATGFDKDEALLARGFWAGHYCDMLNLALCAAVEETYANACDIDIAQGRETKIAEPDDVLPVGVEFGGYTFTYWHTGCGFQKFSPLDVCRPLIAAWVYENVSTRGAGFAQAENR